MKVFESNLLRQWAEVTTWHGVRDLFSSSHLISRIIWIFILLATSSMCALNIYTHTHDFSNGNDWITITYYERNHSGIEFPNLTICNFNRASKTKLESLNMSVDVAAYILDSLQEPFGGLESYDPVMNDRIEKEYLKYSRVRGNWPISDWLRAIAPKCEDVLDACFIGLVPLGAFNCCASVRYLDIYGRGQCMILRPPERLLQRFPQTSAGVRMGLHMFLNPHLDDYAPVYESGMAPTAGFLLFAGYDPEYYSQFTTPVAIEPGTHTWIGMSMERHTITRRSQIIPLIYPSYIPPWPCIHDTNLLTIEAHYAFEICVGDCMVQLALRTCGCSPPEALKPHIKKCDPVTWHRCRTENPVLNQRDPSWVEFETCTTGCGRPCEKKKIQLQASSTLFPNPNQAEAFGRFVFQMRVAGTWPSRDAVDQLSAVDIFFQSTKMKIIEKQERVTFEELISKIGGSLGLWAGMSVITVYQGFLFLVRSVWKRAKCNTAINVTQPLRELENGDIPNGVLPSQTDFSTNFTRDKLYMNKPYFTFSEFSEEIEVERKISAVQRATDSVRRFLRQ